MLCDQIWNRTSHLRYNSSAASSSATVTASSMQRLAICLAYWRGGEGLSWLKVLRWHYIIALFHCLWHFTLTRDSESAIWSAAIWMSGVRGQVKLFCQFHDTIHAMLQILSASHRAVYSQQSFKNIPVEGQSASRPATPPRRYWAPSIQFRRINRDWMKAIRLLQAIKYGWTHPNPLFLEKDFPN